MLGRQCGSLTHTELRARSPGGTRGQMHSQCGPPRAAAGWWRARSAASPAPPEMPQAGLTAPPPAAPSRPCRSCNWRQEQQQRRAAAAVVALRCKLGAAACSGRLGPVLNAVRGSWRGGPGARRTGLATGQQAGCPTSGVRDSAHAYPMPEATRRHKTSESEGLRDLMPAPPAAAQWAGACTAGSADMHASSVLTD